MAASAYCKLSDLLTGITRGRVRWIGLWIMLHAGSLPADELPESLQFHGFASQGYTWTSENNFFGSSTDGGTFEPTELGVNASWLPFNNVQLSGQVLYRRAGETDPGELKLDYGLVDYTLLSDDLNRWGVRLGRVKNPSGFYNETRDVAFTRPSILLPQSIYPDHVRGLSLSSDGLYVYGERRSEYGDFFLQTGLGYPQDVDRELEPLLFGGLTPGGFESDTSYISRLLYEWNGGQLRAAITYFQGNFTFDPEAGIFFPLPGSLSIEPWIFSFQYNAERWSLTTEYSLRTVHIKDFGRPSITNTEEAYYIQGTYRFLRDWEAVLRYDVFYRDRDDKDGTKFTATDPFGRPAHSRFAKDWTVGLNWNVTPEFSLRVEYHRVNGTAWLPPLDNPIPSETSQDWDLFLFMASYRF